MIPMLMYNMACGYHLTGEDEQAYKPLLLKAYYCALAIDDCETAEIIQQDAEETFNILLP